MQTEKRRQRDRLRAKKAILQYRATKHVKERDIQFHCQALNPHFVSLDREVRPDFWDPETCRFVEIKLASGVLIRGFYDLHSRYFPQYYFKRVSLKKRRYLRVDELIDLYPKPLLVKIYSFNTGQFLGERFFPQNQIEKIEIKEVDQKRV
jgi:hypothetical protein